MVRLVDLKMVTDIKFTEKQIALLTQLARRYPIGKVVVSGPFAAHALRTAKSLARQGWLQLGENGAGDQIAYFNGDNYAEWMALNPEEGNETGDA